jgi:sugar phosphate isomerase/epimerase
MRATLDDCGLVASSAHVNLAASDEFARALDEHAPLGCATVVVPVLPPKSFTDRDAIARGADALNRANDQARERGLTLAYHNHFWELPLVDDRPALLQLFDAVDPSIVAEVDVYWARVGGVDPATLLRELGARVGFLHVKDGPAEKPEQNMVAVGDGAIDVPGVIAAAPDVPWHVVELDRCDTDMFDAVERSYQYLVGNGLSRGRR